MGLREASQSGGVHERRGGGPGNEAVGRLERMSQGRAPELAGEVQKGAEPMSRIPRLTEGVRVVGSGLWTGLGWSR